MSQILRGHTYIATCICMYRGGGYSFHLTLQNTTTKPTMPGTLLKRSVSLSNVLDVGCYNAVAALFDTTNNVPNSPIFKQYMPTLLLYGVKEPDRFTLFCLSSLLCPYRGCKKVWSARRRLVNETAALGDRFWFWLFE